MSRATYHLWLKPSGAFRDTLTRTIRKLAHELGSPTFEPHVTLLADLIGTEQDHVRRSRIAARQLRPFSIILNQPSYLNQYFQCLFMRVQQTPSLMSAHSLVRRVFEKPEDSYMPHLSLAYGSHPESRKRDIIGELSPEVETSFDVTALFLIRAESNDPKEWHEINSCPFRG
jgi:2'-5' RNA ligase